MTFPKRAGPYKVRVSSAYGFWGPHLVLHGEMFMKSSEISQNNHQILRTITIQIPIKITNRNPYQCEAPKISKLVNITPTTMVYGTYNYSYWVESKPTYNWGGLTLYKSPFFVSSTVLPIPR